MRIRLNTKGQGFGALLPGGVVAQAVGAARSLGWFRTLRVGSLGLIALVDLMGFVDPALARGVS